MKKLVCACCLALLLCALSATALGDLPYTSLGYGADDLPVYMQSLYAPVEVIGQNLFLPEGGDTAVTKGLANPSGLCTDAQGFLYVADRDNHRVVKIDAKGNLYQIFGVSEDKAQCLKAPEGVFVADDGTVYVADTGNARIAVFGPDGRMLRGLTQPDDVRLQHVMFVPISVAVDARGFLFTVLKGGNEGLLVLNPEGKFQGFFGRNKTELTLGERIKRLFFTEEQVRTNSNKVAASVSGVAIGKDGYVYTCTRNILKGQIKKFNARGIDLFLEKDMKMTLPAFLGPIDSAISSLYVNEIGMIYATDRNNGMVLIYDNTGKAVSCFGAKLVGNDQRIGMFGEPCGIATAPDGTLYVLDRNYNGIHVFRPTLLMRQMLKATTLLNDGKYPEAAPLWQSVLKANSFMLKANYGLGKAAFARKDWQESMARMQAAFNQEGYSAALWQYRAEWVQKHATVVFLTLMGLFALNLLLAKVFHIRLMRSLRAGLVWCGRRLIKPWFGQIPGALSLCAKVRYAFKVLRHPVNTYYDVTRLGKGSVPSALCVYALFVAVMILEAALTNFCFNKWGMRDMTLQRVLLYHVAPILIWTAATYLVGSISKGQGTLKGVFITAVYALMPLVVCTLPLALLSNLLTKSEEAIYILCKVLLFGWTAILLFVQVKEVHGYELPETFVRILWILFTAAMIVVGLLAISGIVNQSYNFVNEFVRELTGYV